MQNVGLKQRMQKQLLWLMYIMSHDDTFVRVPPHETRSALKIVFKLLAKVVPIYEHSPYYQLQGKKLWNELDKKTQRKDNVVALKKKK